MGRKPREIRVTLLPSRLPLEEGIERWRQATEILLRAQDRMDKREAALKQQASQVKTSGSRPVLQINYDELLRDFVQVAALASISISEKEITLEVLSAPHQRPKHLPPCVPVVCIFCTRWQCLKVFRAGSDSAARFTRYPYVPRSSCDSLAKSLLGLRSKLEVKGEFAAAAELTDGAQWDEATIGEWLERNTTRIHFFFEAKQSKAVLSLFEAFLQCRLNPMFENG